MLRNKETGKCLSAYKILSVAVILSTLFFTACTSNGTAKTENTSANISATAVGNASSTAVPKGSFSVTYDDEDTNTAIGSNATIVTLNGTSIAVDGTGASASGSKLNITAGGTYQLSGTLSDGQIIVNTTSKTTVRLILKGVDITCSDSAPIYIMDAKKAVLILADGTKNSLTDGTKYTLTDVQAQEPSATLFCKCDMTITGNGSLTIAANYNNGITGKDNLKITGGTISITAVVDGIKGRDYTAIKNANITVDAKADGIKSSNDVDSALGFVSIESGTLNINAGMDGIKAETDVSISGGTFIIKSADDALDSNGSMTISGGSLKLTAVDKGMNAATSLTITGGNIAFTPSTKPIPAS